MDILQAARNLRPGTAWNYDGFTLTQAEDGSLRVPVPTQKEIDDYIQAHPDPIDVSKAILKDVNATTDAKVAALIKVLGL